MKRFLSKLMPKSAEFWFGLIMLLLSALALLAWFVCWKHPDSVGLISESTLQQRWMAATLTVAVIFSIIAVAGVLLMRQVGKTGFDVQLKGAGGDDIPAPRKYIASQSLTQTLSQELKRHLHSRYRTFWRGKVRLLLVTGEDSAIDVLVPNLSSQQWLEGNRTVLIYGGSLNSEPDAEILAALRKLRHNRPLDGIVHLLKPHEELISKQSDTYRRSLEKISATLRWQAPIWLWQIGHSAWSQDGREQYAPGLTFSARAVPDDVRVQIENLIPLLREQGMTQISQHASHDWLLRLSRELAEQSQQWQQWLAPWFDFQRKIPLRGLIFSLPEAAASATGVHPHAISNSTMWQSISQDKMRGRSTGLPWERVLAWSLMGLMLLWYSGMMVSFGISRYQILSAADKAQTLMNNPAVNDAQLIALHSLRNDLGLQQHWLAHRSPWYQRFGLSHTQELHTALLPWYAAAENRLIREAARTALEAKLTRLADLPPGSPLRAALALPGYDQLKAWLMMSRPNRAESDFFVQIMKAVQPERKGISTALWQSLSPDLWAFYAANLPQQPQWQIKPDLSLLGQVRLVLLQQIGQRNAESTLYQNVLQAVRRNYADVSLEDMAPGTDPIRLFTSDQTVPGMFTRQAWEGGMRQEIEKAASARRDQIDWVLSDSRRSAVSQDISPEALAARLTQRYFTDFAASWLNFLNSLRLNPANNIADVIDQLTLLSDVRQSPLIALMNTVAWQGQTGQKRAALSDKLINSAKDLISQKEKPAIDQQVIGPEGPLDATFGPLLALMGKSSGAQLMAADSTLSLQTYLTRITRVRLRLQQVAAAPDPQEMLQKLAQTVFQGKSVDLTDTQQYGSLMAASLGEEWSGFGQTFFVQPLNQYGVLIISALIREHVNSASALERRGVGGIYGFCTSPKKMTEK
ncbi:ImcF-related family protein [Erwinia typographi]|uniref:ImcF-related family protein n=1 Tax=Erwinia typographi TaxID=371042 RepID=UPI000AC21D55